MQIKKYAPVVLRLGLVVVFIWFGYNQLLSQTMWLALIPSWVPSFLGVSGKTLVIINGAFEVCMAVLLAFGIKIRLVASLLALHLAIIIGDIGFSAIGIRDAGLLFATMSVALNGADMYSYDTEEVTIPQ